MDDCIINVRKESAKVIKSHQITPRSDSAIFNYPRQGTLDYSTCEKVAINSLKLNANPLKPKLRIPKKLTSHKQVTVVNAIVDSTLHEKKVTKVSDPSATDKTLQRSTVQYPLKSNTSRPTVKVNKVPDQSATEKTLQRSTVQHSLKSKTSRPTIKVNKVPDQSATEKTLQRSTVQHPLKSKASRPTIKVNKVPDPSATEKTLQRLNVQHPLKSNTSRPTIKSQKSYSRDDKSFQKPSSDVIDDCKRNMLSFSTHADRKFTETQDKVDTRSTENPLQTKFGPGKTHGTEAVNKLMSSTVSTHIEPVFSSQLWKTCEQDLSIHPHLSACLLERFKLSHLTAIQQSTIPALLKGNDALVRAQTGSGKTLAYAVPLLNELINTKPPISRTDGPLALVILPTRELATQTFEVFHGLVNACVRIVPACLIGGTKRKSQKCSLRKGVNIVISTPQRLIDHIIRTTSLHLGRLKWLIIDEADRLMEMGFERCVRQILDHIVKVRTDLEDDGKLVSKLQTVLLSATLTQGVDQLAGLALNSPVRCIVGDAEGQHSTDDTSNTLQTDQFAMPAGLQHFLLVVPWKLRLVSLAAFILLKCRYHRNGGKLIVFMATQDCVDFHYQLFKAVLCPDDEELLSVVSSDVTDLLLFRLHGSMQHSERESVFRQFASSASGILLTTDVASRGLDLAGVGWVVQYHVTGSPVDYVHRVGRTARAGGKGKALIFLDPSELGFTELLESRFRVPFEKQLSLSDLLQTALFHLRHTRRPGRQGTTNCATVEDSASRFGYLFMDAVAEDGVLAPLAESAYTSFIRAYASFSGELREYFAFKRLHLGHVARAFCLKVTPSEVARRVIGRSRRMDDRNPINSKNTSGKRIQDGTRLKRGFDDDTFDDSSNKRAKLGPSIGRGVSKARQNMLAEYGL